MRARRPRRIRVDGETVHVQWKQSLGQFEQGYALGGYYFPKAKAGPTIQVATETSRLGQRRTFMHEMGHHLWRKAGFHRRFKQTTEELVVEELMSWTLLALRENPVMTRWLLEKDD